ncbi:MAG: hypothetical protein ACRDPM_02640, partial [Solirubrobacteraceae bacterium]
RGGAVSLALHVMLSTDIQREPLELRGDSGEIRAVRAQVARAAAETFRDCAHAVSGYATALDHCQSEIKRLRHVWEHAKHRQAANEALALKLTTSITATTRPDAATRINTQAATASGQATDAGVEADGYALRATTALNQFTHKASSYRGRLEGYSPGEAPGPFGAPFTAPGTPGRTFGLPSDGVQLPGDAHSLDPYNGVIPVGDPWNSPIPGYGIYKDATTPEVEPTDDLTNFVLLIATLGGGSAADFGGNALKAIAERLGLGTAGRQAVKEAGEEAYEKEIADAIASGEGKHASFVKILQRARDARLGAGAETESAQQEARADLIDDLLDNADKAGVVPDGVKDVVAELAHHGWAYTSYTTAKLDAVRTALLKTSNPAARAAAKIIGTILRYKQ